MHWLARVDLGELYIEPRSYRLRQRRSGFGFHKGRINGVDESIHINVFAEIAVSHGVTGLRFRLTNVNRVGETVVVGVANQQCALHTRIVKGGVSVIRTAGRIVTNRYAVQRDKVELGILNSGQTYLVLV